MADSPIQYRWSGIVRSGPLARSVLLCGCQHQCIHREWSESKADYSYHLREASDRLQPSESQTLSKQPSDTSWDDVGSEPLDQSCAVHEQHQRSLPIFELAPERFENAKHTAL